jgi:TetR/AcrR family transcriptional regulator, regulator of cefoperazone and chloramphenicol sensitivity
MLDRDTRRRVLEAAGPIFAAQGCDAASVRDICKKAGANVSAVNYHFRSKEQLYVEAVRHAYESVAERVPLPAFPPEMPARARLRLFVRTMLERLEQAEAGWHCDLVMREVSQPTGGACAEFVRDFVRPAFGMLLSVLDGLLPPEVPSNKRFLLAHSVMGQVLHRHHARHVMKLLLGPDEYGRLTADAWADHITEFTLAALERLYPRGKGDGR